MTSRNHSKKLCNADRILSLVDINERDQHGNTFLHLAAKSANLSEIEYLLDHGADPEVVNKDGETPLHVAIEQDAGTRIIKKLMTTRTMCMMDHRQRTPLMLAASLKDRLIVEKLLIRGVPADQESDLGTALHFACIRDKNISMIQRLIQAGANPIKKSRRYGYTPLMVAVCHRANHNADYLLHKYSQMSVQDDDDNYLTHLAARNGNSEMLRSLLERGLLATWRNKWGSTVLHEACKSGSSEPLQVLIDWDGGKLFQNVPKDNRGRTPLHYLAQSGTAEMIQLYLAANSYPPLHDQDDSGYSPLDVALKCGNDDAVKIFQQRKERTKRSSL